MPSLAVDRAAAALLRGDASILFLALDAQDRVQEANRHAEELLGRQLHGAAFADLVVNFDQRTSPAALVQAGPTARRFHFLGAERLPVAADCWLSPADGRTVLVGRTPSPEQLRLRREMLRLTQDLSARTRELQQANAELTQLSAMKDQFLGMAAHDLRTPLVAVTLHSRLLAEELALGLSDEHRRDLEAIGTAAELMKRIVDGFLDLAQIEAGKLRLSPSEVALREVVESALSLVGPAARTRRVKLRTLLADLPALQVDRPKLQQVVVNLALNAVQHSPAGSEVEVALRREPDAAVLEVRDRGQGIPLAVRAHLFQAYSRGDGARDAGERSTGLGLAIARLVVEAHGGTITCDTAPGQGTVMTVRLPLRPAA